MKKIPRALIQFGNFVHRYRRKFLMIGGVLILLLFIFVNYRLFAYRKSVVFNYDRPTCFQDPTFLPNLAQEKNSGMYKANRTGGLRVKGRQIFSRATCIEAQQLPQEGGKAWVSVATFGSPLIKKHFRVTGAAYPMFRADTILGPTLSPKEVVKMPLDKADKVFDYYLNTADKQQHCDTSDQTVSCDVQSLGLAQGTPYVVTVQRFFGEEKVGDVIKREVTTTTPVEIVGGSVQPGGTIYDVPAGLRVSAGKPLATAEVELYAITVNGRELVNQTTTIEDKDIVVTFGQPLARNTGFELHVKQATATDKGFLDKPYVVPFTVSGGPRVAGINIGKASADPAQTIVITFDQAIDPAQDFSKLAIFTSAAGSGYAASVQGQQLTIRPTARMPLCSVFSIQLSNDIKSVHGISGHSAWSYNSRVICYTVSTIGYSARGRPIQAWRFGSGASKVLYVGATHGDEKSTKYLLDRWIAELEAHPEKIPAGRTIIVIPNLNPDGFAAGSRRNANGVDLNRNFPANDWKPDVTMPGGGGPVQGGGGSQPLSEPESRALASFITSEAPRLVLTYHSIASVVSANGVGDSGSLARSYSGLSGYRNLPGSETESVFQYDTTGAMEEWLADRVGIPALLIELGSHSNSEFSRNSAAMWAMAQI